MNYVKTFSLMVLLIVLFMIVGQAIGGNQGILFALIFAIGMNFFAYWFSDKITLKAYHATELTQYNYPQIYARVYPIVSNLAQRANLTMPRLYSAKQHTKCFCYRQRTKTFRCMHN